VLQPGGGIWHFFSFSSWRLLGAFIMLSYQHIVEQLWINTKYRLEVSLMAKCEYWLMPEGLLKLEA
jgi:hypothetical protein